jgi:uncharacterized protein YndB with AHSA1/START domain
MTTPSSPTSAPFEEPPIQADEFLITHTFDAPREAVYQAWTDPLLMAQWWGPHTFTNPVCNMDVRSGGAYRIVMRSAEGVDYPLTGVFQQVHPPELLVLTMCMDEHPADWHALVRQYRRDKSDITKNPVTTVSFAAAGSQMKLTIWTRYESTDLRDALVELGMAEGWSQSFERLRSLLADLQPPTQ